MKKRLLPLLAVVALCAGLFTSTASAAETGSASQAPGVKFAEGISTITGVAISPLLGTGAFGAVKYFRTPQASRASLPWFAQPWFWGPALLIVGLCFLKDTAGTALPTAFKKPLDLVETVEHKVSGLIAAGAFVPFLVMMNEEFNAVGGSLSSAGFATADFSWLYNILLVPVAMIVFAIVFLASNAINILILLSPFTTVDTALKGARAAILATVAGSALMNPWIGALWALIIIGVSWFIAGWSLRLSHFGWVFIWDFFTGRSKRFKPDAVANKMFLSRKLNKVPARTYGKLCRDGNGKLVLQYRPWLILPQRTVELPAGKYEAGRGLMYSEILRVEGDDTKTVILLPPRYRGHEVELVKIYGFAGSRDVGFRAMWKWFKELCGFKAQPQLAA